MPRGFYALSVVLHHFVYSTAQVSTALVTIAMRWSRGCELYCSEFGPVCNCPDLWQHIKCNGTVLPPTLVMR